MTEVEKLRQRVFDHLDTARTRAMDRDYDCAIEELGSAIIALAKLIIMRRNAKL